MKADRPRLDGAATSALFEYVPSGQQLKFGIPDRSDVMLPRDAPLARAHNSLKEHATKILGAILER